MRINKNRNLANRFRIKLEAPPRFELGNKGFADLRLTTWLWRQMNGRTILDSASIQM